MNLSQNITDSFGDHQLTSILSIIETFAFSIIFILSVPGNLLVLFLVSHKHQHNTRSYSIFIRNLAISDLSMIVFSIPFDLALQRITIFPLGEAVCKILYPLQTISTSAGVNTLVALSYQRSRLIVEPLEPLMTGKQTFSTVVAVWIVAFVVSLPYSLVLELNQHSQCLENWPTFEYRQAYTTFVFVMQYLLPLGMIVVLNVRAIKHLNRYQKFRENNEIMSEEVIKVHHQIVSMLIVIVTVFAIFMLPHHAMWLLEDFLHGNRWPLFDHIKSISYIFIYANCVANPMIFFKYNANTRKELHKLMKYMKIQRRKNVRLTNILHGCRNQQTVNELEKHKTFDQNNYPAAPLRLALYEDIGSSPIIMKHPV